jgi:hypothetical protein
MEGRLIYISKIPECLKNFSPHRAQLIRDFNSALDMILKADPALKIAKVVFAFSDQNERSQAFFRKIFSDNFMKQLHSNNSVVEISHPGPTNSQIKSELKDIINGENLVISTSDLDNIIQRCNRDLRNAIMTL